MRLSNDELIHGLRFTTCCYRASRPTSGFGGPKSDARSSSDQAETVRRFNAQKT